MSSKNKITNLKAFEIINKIEKKHLTSDEVIKAFVENIIIKNKRYQVFNNFKKKTIFAQLKNQKKTNLLLKGIPIGIKDIFNTIEHTNTMGSKIYKNYNPGNDARVVSDIRKQGGIIMGKTFSSEFAVHEPTLTKNPYNTNFSPGTSSAGSAVAVALNMVPIAIGSQTAGSIVRPASYCGVYGFKPTYGTIARTGALKTTDTLDSIGFFANCIEDLNLIYDVVRQRGHNYPLINKNLDLKRIDNQRKNLYKVGIVKGPKSNLISKSLEKKFQEVVYKNDKKIKYTNINLKKIFNKAHSHHYIIYSKCLSYYLKDEIDKYPQKISNNLLKMIKDGEKISLDQYEFSLEYQKMIIKKIDDIFNTVDFLIDLSTFTIAPKFGENGLPDHNLIWTMSHIPSISLPLIKDRFNMPVGIQVNSKKFNDYELLNFCKYFIK